MIITGYGNYIGLGVLPSMNLQQFAPPAPAPAPTPSVVRLAPSAMYPSTPYIGPLVTARQFNPQVMSSLQQAVPGAFFSQPGVAVVPSGAASGYTTIFGPQYMFQTPIPGAGCPPGSMPGKYPDTCIPIGDPNAPAVPQGQTLVKTAVNVSTPSTKAAEQAVVDYDQLLPAGAGPSVAVATPNKAGIAIAAGAALLLLGFMK